MRKVKRAYLETVIAVEITKGSGIEKDPVRMVIQYWDLNGNLLFELEPTIN